MKTLNVINFNNLPKDIMIKMALFDMDLNQLILMCRSSAVFNSYICNDDVFLGE